MNILNIFSNEKNIVTLALILIIILGIISYNLYYTSNYDIDGSELGCYDTVKNIFGYLPVISELVDIVGEMGNDATKLVEDNIKEVKDNVIKITKKKEVFNIDNNSFTYNDAKLVCKAYNSELATYDQLLSSYKKVATWCNYGVNCYGYKPEPDKSKISFNEKIYPLPEMKKEEELQKEKIDELKRKIAEGKIQVRPFSGNKWSNYSFKKSTYMISPNNDDDDKETTILEIENSIKDSDKDPRNIEVEEVVEEEDIEEEELDNLDVL